MTDENEEQALGKIYDTRLIARLWPYVRPHSVWIALSLALIPLRALLEVTPPLIVGAAMKSRDQQENPESWGIGADFGSAAKRLEIPREVISPTELPLERSVSEYIGKMPFVWLNVDDPPGGDSLRGIIERNSIALSTITTRD